MTGTRPEDEPIEYTTREVLRHCGQPMRVASSQLRDGIRMRYWKCLKCGRTTVTGQVVPQTIGQQIRQERRH